jgi:hypothetical protein
MSESCMIYPVMCAHSHSSSCMPALSATVESGWVGGQLRYSSTAHRLLEQLSGCVRTPLKCNVSRRRGQLSANSRSTKNCMCALGLLVIVPCFVIVRLA